MSDKEDFKQADNDTARMLQVAMMNAIYKQITNDPMNVSASTLAVAERMLARWNMGLIELPADEKMTEEERQMVKEFDEMNIHFDSKHYETAQ